jgi:ubiquinone/menaquinone biosynthesis C-methylase UbiE
VANAFSRKAPLYDAFGVDHVNLQRMREKVYAHLSRLHSPGSYLLELNAGTGLDAAELVRRGYQVHATDVAPGMIAQIENKVNRPGMLGRLTVQTCSFAQLDQIDAGPFDGVFSNFGGLNCIDDLTQVAGYLPDLLRPGGYVTWVIMPHICPWELALVFKDWRLARRRLRSGGVLAEVEGVRFMTYYFSSRQARRAFGADFRRVRLEGLSVLTPTADNKSFAGRFPRLYAWLRILDDRISQWPPFNGWGDFFILSMQFCGRR